MQAWTWRVRCIWGWGVIVWDTRVDRRAFKEDAMYWVVCKEEAAMLDQGLPDVLAARSESSVPNKQPHSVDELSFGDFILTSAILADCHIS